MSEFDKLAGEAEQEAKDHPQQVHDAEHDAERAAESKLGIGEDHDQGNQGNQGAGSGQDTGQSGQNQ